MEKIVELIAALNYAELQALISTLDTRVYRMKKAEMEKFKQLAEV